MTIILNSFNFSLALPNSVALQVFYSFIILHSEMRQQNGLPMQLHVDFKLKEYCDLVSDFVRLQLWVFGRYEYIFTMFTSLFALMCQFVLAVATPPLYDATSHVTRPRERARERHLA